MRMRIKHVRQFILYLSLSPHPKVVGRKYIRLYDKDQTPRLYPHPGLLSNTSQVAIS